MTGKTPCSSQNAFGKSNKNWEMWNETTSTLLGNVILSSVDTGSLRIVQLVLP